MTTAHNGSKTGKTQIPVHSLCLLPAALQFFPLHGFEYFAKGTGHFRPKLVARITRCVRVYPFFRRCLVLLYG